MNSTEQIRAARAEYARNYRKKHPEKVKAAQERYWLRKAEKAQQMQQDGGGADAKAEI